MPRLQPLEIMNTVTFRGSTIEKEGKDYADMAWYDKETGKIVVSRNEVESITADKLRGLV